MKFFKCHIISELGNKIRGVELLKVMKYKIEIKAMFKQKKIWKHVLDTKKYNPCR